MPETESTESNQGTDESATDEAQVDWKAKAREWEKRAKQNTARIAELEPKANQFDVLEQASKSDVERFQEKLAETQRQLETTQRQALVASVALDEGLTPSQAKRLIGGTHDELLADAREMKAELAQAAQANGPRRPAPDASQGSSAAGGSSDNEAANWLQNLVRK